MNRFSKFLLVAGAFAMAGTGIAKEIDPRDGQLTYYGSGYAESAPEYGEVFLTYRVGCRKSAEDVRKAIEAESGPAWQAIVKKVAPTEYSETERTYWQSIGGISESEGSRLVTQRPRKERVAEPRPTQPVIELGGPRALPQPQVNVVEGKAERIDICKGVKIGLTDTVPSTFSGSQTIGVRTTDMDWLEGLVKKINEREQSEDKDAVKVSAGSISYAVTDATKREMLQDTLDEATAQATGDDSQFRDDVANAKLKNAHYQGVRLAIPPRFRPQVGNAVSRGGANKVELELPITYTFYHEVKDALDKENSEVRGETSEYEVTGNAVAEADYAQTGISASVRCQATKEAAAAAIKPIADELAGSLRAYQGDRESTETDAVVIPTEGAKPWEDYPYQPVAWVEDAASADFGSATKYLNTCTNTIVDAPESGDTSDLDSYWNASLSYQLKSSDFERLVNTTEELQLRHNTATTDTTAVRVSVDDARGAVTSETTAKMVQAARAEATTCAVDPTKSALAGDIRNHGFTCAHLKGIRIGRPVPKIAASRSLRGAGPNMAALESMADVAPESGELQSGELEVEVVTRDNGERPKFTMSRSYAFDYVIRSANYVEAQ